VFRRYGSADLVLLNHDICGRVEDPDIKRFKLEVAAYCETPVSYANMPGWDQKDQFDVVVEAGAFKVGNGTALCTNRLKTAPFQEWLKQNHPDGSGCVVYYGFGPEERQRVQRRAWIMEAQGYQTAFPLVWWPPTIYSTLEIGIAPPLTYSVFKHANCTGCLKAGMQHWYVVFCTRPDIWKKALWAESEIGYTIIKGHVLADLEVKFSQMRAAGIVPTEKIPAGTFWAQARRLMPAIDPALISNVADGGGPTRCSDGPGGMPCECAT
jgi:hypothetical protein